MDRATFKHMQDSTAADWKVIAGEFMPYAAKLPDRLFDHLRLLAGDYGGFPIDRLAHCLQTATLAHRDGRDEEYVVCALLHDIGDTLGSWNHPDVAAAIVKPFVRPEYHWMVAQHGVFQGYYFFHHLGMDRNARDQFKDHPNYALAEEFCAKYDAPAFDPAGETLPLEFFAPMVRRVFAQPKQSLYRDAVSYTHLTLPTILLV